MAVVNFTSGVNNQSVNVQYTENGAKTMPYHLFGSTWKEDEHISAHDAISELKADFNVSKQPLIRVPQSVYDAIKNGTPIGELNLSTANLISSHCATVRDDYDGTLGVVGSEYSVANNTESLAFVDMLEEVSGHKVSITSGGVLGHGERFFLQGKMDKSVYLNGDKDEIEQYVIFTNTHDGSGGLAIFMSPIRVICQNSLRLALRTPNKIVYKHTKNLNKRIDWQIAANRERALEVFKKSAQFTKEFEEKMLMLKAKDGITQNDTLDFTAKLFLDNKNFDLYMKNGRNWDGVEEISTRSKNQMNALLDTIHNGVGQKGYYEGTALHLLNGLTCYQQNVVNYRNLDTQFDSMLDGTENNRLNKAYQLLVAA